MGREDQEEERETLKSIFPDELTEVSDTVYRISVTLDVGDTDDSGSESPTLILQVSYPEKYPDVAPDLEIMAPPNAPKYPHLDIHEDRARLLDALQSTIEENMGMAMIFAVVDTLKEGAELLISERKASIQAMKEFEAAKAEEEENRKFQGTLVTRESFLEWHAKFQQEMLELEQKRQEEKEAEDKKKKTVKEEKRLTGRQLWEKGLAGKGDYDEDFDDMVPAEKMERLKMAT